jgi:hypothetical protein
MRALNLQEMAVVEEQDGAPKGAAVQRLISGLGVDQPCAMPAGSMA